MIKRDEPSEDKTIELGHKLYQVIAKKVRAETLAEVEKIIKEKSHTARVCHKLGVEDGDQSEIYYAGQGKILDGLLSVIRKLKGE